MSLSLSRPIAFGVLLLLLGPAMQLTAQKIELENMLIARYLFNGNANNEVEDANHGLPTNVSYTVDRNGKYSSCVSFNGVSSYIIIPHTEDLNWDARTDSYTILFWVKSDNPQNNNEASRRILNKWNEVLSQGYPFSFQYTAAGLRAGVYSTAGTIGCSLGETWNNEWRHVAMTWDHIAGKLTAYVDGTIVTSKSTVIASSTKNSENIQIGFSQLQGKDVGYYFGLFDDLYFYDRVLNPCEVEALYSDQLVGER